MLLTDHALTGIALGSVIDEPWVALPAGFASHLLLDATPHSHWLPYRFIHKRRRADPIGIADLRDWRGLLIGSMDFLGALIILAVGWTILPQRRIAITAGWLGAIAPDLLYIPELLFKKRYFPRFKAFHHKIQWSESIYGVPFEFAWAMLMLHALHLI